MPQNKTLLQKYPLFIDFIFYETNLAKENLKIG